MFIRWWIIPKSGVNVDRNKAGQVGLSQSDVANSLLISLSGTGQIAPAQWLNWATGVQYQIGAQTPQRKIDSLDALMRTPIAPVGKIANATGGIIQQDSVGASPNQASMAYGNPGAGADPMQHLSNLATTVRGVAPQIVNHYDVQPVFDVYANVDRQDLGSVGAAVQKIMDEAAKTIPRSMTLDLRGQIATMQTSFYRLGLGLIFAIVLVYFLMALNFQSWLDPVHHSYRFAWRFGRHSLDAVRHSDDVQRAFTDGRDHVYRSRHRQQYSGGRLRQRPETGRHGRARGRAGGGLDAHPASADDRCRDDHRYVADGARPRRRRRAEFSAGPRCDRRPDSGDRDDPVYCAGRLQPFAKEAAD